MIIKSIAALSFLFVLSCSNIELVLNKKNQTNKQLKDKVSLVSLSDDGERFSKELYSYFGNNISYEYILKTTFIEKKENVIIKKNQVAEKINYTLEVKYELFYKTTDCKIFNEKITSEFSFTPKSSGYNFGADISFENLYTNSVIKNIESFVDFGPFKTSCSQ